MRTVNVKPGLPASHQELHCDRMGAWLRDSENAVEVLRLISDWLSHYRSFAFSKLDMDAAARQAVNLTVLRRHDPTITTILDSSSHVVVYDFDMKGQLWVCIQLVQSGG